MHQMAASRKLCCDGRRATDVGVGRGRRVLVAVSLCGQTTRTRATPSMAVRSEIMVRGSARDLTQRHLNPHTRFWPHFFTRNPSKHVFFCRMTAIKFVISKACRLSYCIDPISENLTGQAHNLKVVGSNPTPATNDTCETSDGPAAEVFAFPDPFRRDRLLRFPATNDPCESRLSSASASARKSG